MNEEAPERSSIRSLTEPLDLPACDLAVRERGGRPLVFDAIRRKYVRLTPEEWVRQHVVHHLVRDLGVPRALVAIEKGFLYQGMLRRADVVVHDRRGAPLLMVECKAPGVAVQQEVFDQVAAYNQVLRAAYLVVTNGRVHYCCALDFERHAYRFLDALPHYEEMLRGRSAGGSL